MFLGRTKLGVNELARQLNVTGYLGVCATEKPPGMTGASLRHRSKNCQVRSHPRFSGRSPVPTTFRPHSPDQPLLLPPDLRDWLPAGDLAYQISDLVDSLDLSAFYAPYAGDGRRNRPYDPKMMVKLLLYGYATGVFSSRKIASRLRRDVAFRCLAASQQLPAHRTICEFCKRHLGDFKNLFVQVVAIAAEMGLAKLGTLAVDGSKVKASASRRKAMTYRRMLEREQKLRAEIDELLERAEAIDLAEDEEYGPDGDGEDVPEELKRRRDRLARIEAAKARLEEKARRFDDGRGR